MQDCESITLCDTSLYHRRPGLTVPMVSTGHTQDKFEVVTLSCGIFAMRWIGKSRSKSLGIMSVVWSKV